MILLADFNVESEKTNMESAFNVYTLRNLVNEKNCFKNVEFLSYFDFISTNCSKSF